MTTLNQICFDLWNHIRGNISDDDTMDIRMLKYFVHNQRSIWIRNNLNKNRDVDDNIVQDLGAVPIEIVDRQLDNVYIQDKKILRTVSKIPVAIELNSNTALTRIGSLDIRERPFQFIDYSRLPYIGKGKFNSKEIFTFLLNGYIYIVTDCNNPLGKVIKYINIRGVFENPEEVASFTNELGVSCYSDDSPYPINKWMIPFMKAEILKLDLKQFVLPTDESNNSNAELENLKATNDQK